MTFSYNGDFYHISTENYIKLLTIESLAERGRLKVNKEELERVIEDELMDNEDFIIDNLNLND
jgi:hypothetical protein